MCSREREREGADFSGSGHRTSQYTFNDLIMDILDVIIIPESVNCVNQYNII